jgi:ribonucleoside-diphosphate reductase alpha chain
LGNCFVIGNDADSYGGICTTDQEQVQLMKRRAGVGHDISHLRPAKSVVTNAAKTSSGAVSFMPRYSNSTREVGQDGRRGALMLSMDINHPDIEDFITSKDDTTKITGANISVKVDDGFMMNIAAEEYDIVHPNNLRLWNKLIHQSWKSAEPGVLFWDKITSESPADCYEGFESISTNPLT